MGRKTVLIIIAMLLFTTVRLFAGIPTITSAITDDTDGNGYIDTIHITFSENVDINDPNGAADGLDCLTVTGYTIANADYSATNVTTMDLFLNELGSYDTDATPDITYNQGQTTRITSVSTSQEMADNYNFNSTADGASPVIVKVDIARALQNSKYWWNRIILTFSEPVFCGDLAPGSSLTASDNDDETGGGFDTGHGGDYNSGNLGGYGSFSTGGDVIVPSGEVGITVNANGVVTFDLGRGANGHGSIASGATQPSGVFTPVVNNGIRDNSNNTLVSTNPISVNIIVNWDLTKPTIDVAKTYDNDHDGHIDRVEFEISEDIQDGFSPANFDINGYNGESFNTSVVGISGGYDGDANDNRFSIVFNENIAQFDTSNTPTYNYSGSAIYLVDLAGNRLSNVSGGTTQDGSPPAFSSIVTNDSDNNGHIDQIAIQFSEDVIINDVGGLTDGLNCIGVAGYSITDGDYSFNPLNQGNNLILNLSEINSYDTDATPNVTYNVAGSSSITDLASNEMLNGETTTTIDGANPYMLAATFNDPDHNDIDSGDYISVEFDEPVQLNCTNSSDFVLLNSAYGDTFGTGSYLSDATSNDNYVEITLGDNPHLILPGLWSGPGDKMPSGLGINQSGTLCVTDLAGNPPSNTPEVDIGGSGSNNVAMVVATDGADVFSNPNSRSTFMDTDISISITLDYKALYVALWYDVGRNPDGANTQNSSDKKVLATGSGKSWKATIPGDDPDIKEGAEVRFILDIDGSLYYSDGSESSGGSIPWSFTIVYEQKDRVTIRNNMINPKAGDLVYLNYYLSGSRKVRIIVFDLAGDLVKILKNKTESSGSHLVTWNGRNQKGQNCIPGLYYVLIKIGKKRYVKKVLILK